MHCGSHLHIGSLLSSLYTIFTSSRVFFHALCSLSSLYCSLFLSSQLLPVKAVPKQRQFFRRSLSSAHQGRRDNSACPRGVNSICTFCFEKGLLLNVGSLDEDQTADTVWTVRVQMSTCNLMFAACPHYSKYACFKSSKESYQLQCVNLFALCLFCTMCQKILIKCKHLKISCTASQLPFGLPRAETLDPALC